MKKIIIIVLLFVCTAAFAQNKDIPVTRDLDPNAQYDTYKDWVAKNPPRETISYEISRSKGNMEGEGFLIVITPDLYYEIEQSLLVFQQDLIDDGFNTFVLLYDGVYPADLKLQIQTYYHLDEVINVVLIGNLPVAWYEMFEDWNDNGTQDPDEDWVEFPCDLFFTDTNGLWGDVDEDGVFDFHIGEMHPEIGLGRIVAGNMNMVDQTEKEILDAYFQRNHLFRDGIISSYNTSLAYIDDDWSYWGDQYQQSMLLAYPSVELVDDIEQTIANDYLNNRLISSYEMIQVHVHSGPESHYFYYNNSNSYQIVYNFQVADMYPNAHFYNLFACSNSRYTSDNNLGGLYIYCSDHGLATIGSTKTGSMLEFDDFYQPFSEDKTIGESLRLWWVDNVDTAAYSGWERAWFYGMIIQGDPSLRRQYPENDQVYAYFDADAASGFVPHAVQFNDLSDAPNQIVTWEWDFQNDGIIDSYQQNPSYTYLDSGSYSVSLTVTDINNASDTLVREQYVNVSVADIFNITQNVGFGTIQQGIDFADEGDTIIVNTGVYYENINFNGKNITLASKYLTTRDTSYIDQTILDGNDQDCVVRFSGGEDSTAILSGFTIRNGHSSTGGGIHCNDASPGLYDLRIVENSSTSGGGILLFNSSSHLRNVTIAKNNSTYYGGGIFCNKSLPVLENVTIEGNVSDYQGGGLFCFNNSAPILTNTIMWNDHPQEVYFSENYDPNTIEIQYSDVAGGEFGIVINNNGLVYWQVGNIDADPLFVDAANGNYHLSWEHFPIADSTKSPCIDVGSPNTSFDPDGTIADMGAYYFHQTVAIDEPQEVTGNMLMAFPNPVGSQNATLAVSYSINKPCNVKIQLFNIKGQLVSTIENTNKNPGNYTCTNQVEGFGSGIYFTKLTIDGVDKEVRKVVILR